MEMSWRDDPITEKQEQLIADMEEEACMNDAFIPAFIGTTKAKQVIISAIISKLVIILHITHTKMQETEFEGRPVKLDG